MKLILDANKVNTFRRTSHDCNLPHDEELMWEKHQVPAIVPGLQILSTAMATIDKNELIGIKGIDAYFGNIVPINSEVEFASKQKGNSYRLSAISYGNDALASKSDFTTAAKIDVKERPFFFEGESIANVQPTDSGLADFKEVTTLPNEAAPMLYAISLSNLSIANRIQYPTTDAWTDLKRGLREQDDSKKRIPSYNSVLIYMPGGIRNFNAARGLTMRSAIKRNGPAFVVDTICYDGEDVLYGMRSVLGQRKTKALVKAIEDTLQKIETSGNQGTLEETLTRFHRVRGHSIDRK